MSTTFKSGHVLVDIINFDFLTKGRLYRKARVVGGKPLENGMKISKILQNFELGSGGRWFEPCSGHNFFALF